MTLKDLPIGKNCKPFGQLAEKGALRHHFLDMGIDSDCIGRW